LPQLRQAADRIEEDLQGRDHLKLNAVNHARGHLL